jgi:hypothetical protein
MDYALLGNRPQAFDPWMPRLTPPQAAENLPTMLHNSGSRGLVAAPPTFPALTEQSRRSEDGARDRLLQMTVRWLSGHGFMAILVLAVAAPLLSADDLHAPIQPGSKVTYADLVGIVFPAFERDKDDPSAIVADTSAPIRQSDNSRKPWDGPLKVTGFGSVDIRIPGGPQFLLTFQVDDGGNGVPINAFALFKLAPRPLLLDVIEAPGFPDDPGGIVRTLTLGPHSDALIYGARHSNSQQGYERSGILYVWGGRIDTVYDVMLLNCRGCKDGDFEQSATIDTLKDPGREFDQVAIKIKLKRDADPPDSDHRPRRRAYRRVFSGTFRWDPVKHRFTTFSKELGVFEAFNERNY